MTRCILESLALEYRCAAGQISSLLNRPLPVIHIIGGGSRNKLLNQLTANATKRKVIAGPVEATAIGNIIVQAIAAKQIGSLAEARAVVRNSFDVSMYEPSSTEEWDEAYQRYLNLKNGDWKTTMMEFKNEEQARAEIIRITRIVAGQGLIRSNDGKSFHSAG